MFLSLQLIAALIIRREGIVTVEWVCHSSWSMLPFLHFSLLAQLNQVIQNRQQGCVTIQTRLQGCVTFRHRPNTLSGLQALGGTICCSESPSLCLISQSLLFVDSEKTFLFVGLVGWFCSHFIFFFPPLPQNNKHDFFKTIWYFWENVNCCEIWLNQRNLAILQCPNSICMPLCESPTSRFPIYPRHIHEHCMKCSACKIISKTLQTASEVRPESYIPLIWRPEGTIPPNCLHNPDCSFIATSYKIPRQNPSVILSSRISQISHSINCVDKEPQLKKKHSTRKTHKTLRPSS